MQKKIICIFILLFLISFSYSASLSFASQDIASSKFAKVIIEGKPIYTESRLANSDTFIGTDKIIYYSDKGLAKVKVYFKGKPIEVGKVVVKSKKSPITVANWSGKEIATKGKISTESEIAEKFLIDNSLQEFSFTLLFDPNKVSFMEEFYIYIYDTLGNEIAYLDPWFSNYGAKRNLTITSTSALPSDYTACVAVPQALLSSLQTSDGNDLRVVYQNTTDLNRIFWDGNNYVNRVTKDFNVSSPNISVCFKLQAQINAGATDLNYAIYYSKSNPPAPLQNIKSVYLWADDFDDASIDSRWTQVANGGSFAEEAGYMKITASNGDISGSTFTAPILTYNPAGKITGDFNAITKIDNPSVLASQYDSFGIVARHADTNWSLKRVTWIGTSPFDMRSDSNSGVSSEKGGNRAMGANYYQSINRKGSNFLGCSSATNNTDLNCLYFTPASPLVTNADLNEIAISSYRAAAGTMQTIFFDWVIISRRVTTEPSISLSGEVLPTAEADFNYTTPASLDPENSVNTVTSILTDISFIGASYHVTNWNWLKNGTSFSTDQNTTASFTAIGDYNICLDINANDGDGNYALSSKCQTISVYSAPQGLAISYDVNSYLTTDVNVVFTASATTTVSSWAWTYDGNAFGSSQIASKDFNVADTNAFVCVTATYSSVSKQYCKSFYVSKTIVKIPLWQKDLSTQQTPFTLTFNSVPGQSLTGKVADTNIFAFSDSNSTKYALFVDTNSDFYTQNYLISTFSGLSTLQPYIVEKATGYQTTLYTVDNQNNRQTMPYVTVEVYSNTSAGETLFESVETDGSGVAILHFQASRTYILKFYMLGVFKFSDTFTPTASGNLFAFMASQTISFPASIGSVLIEFYHSPSNVIPAVDGNISIYQLLKPMATTIGDVNIAVSQNGTLYYYRIFHLNSSVDYNLSYDVNVSGLSNFYPLRVDVTVYDTNGYVVSTTQNFAVYSFYTTTRWNDVFGYAKSETGFGTLTLTIISLLLCAWFMRRIVSFRLGEDNNGLFIIASLVTGVFVFVGWIPEDAWIWGVLLSIAMAIVGMRE